MLNATTYESATVIPEGTFTAENLSEVLIDGEKHKNMVLITCYPYEGGTRFALREQTETERENAELRAAVQASEQSAAEMSMMLATLMASMGA